MHIFGRQIQFLASFFHGMPHTALEQVKTDVFVESSFFLVPF